MHIKAILAGAAIALAATAGAATADEASALDVSAPSAQGVFTVLGDVPAARMGDTELSATHGAFVVVTPQGKNITQPRPEFFGNTPHTTVQLGPGGPTQT